MKGGKVTPAVVRLIYCSDEGPDVAPLIICSDEGPAGNHSGYFVNKFK